MSSMQQLHRGEAPSQGHLSETTQDPAAAPSRGLGSGTDFMGEPVDPTSQVHEQGYTGDSAKYSGSYPTSGGSYVPAADSQTSINPPAASSTPGSCPAGGLPPSQIPGHSTSGTQQSTTANASQSSMPSPYVQTTSIPGGTSKTPMDSIMQVFNKWSKKAEDMTGNVWTHLKTGPNVADTALGRIAVSTKAMAEGGIENVFRQTFETDPQERLLKSFACYLSTSTGPVAGTLYISSHKLAFCSDRPLAIPGSSAPNTKHTPSGKTPATTGNTSSAQQQQQQQQWVFYKVTVPISQLEAVNPTENTQKKTPERYVQIKTVDGHEFWFMGFVNYDKGVKNLQETLSAKNTNVSGTMNSTQPSNMYSAPASNTTDASRTTFTPSSDAHSDPVSTTTNAPHETQPSNIPASYTTDAPRTTSTPSSDTYTDPVSTTNNAPGHTVN